jgi:hypothetical protein
MPFLSMNAFLLTLTTSIQTHASNLQVIVINSHEHVQARHEYSQIGSKLASG